MSLSHLQSVLWKNIHMRRYYPVLTILEFIIPIIIFHQGLNFREFLDPIQVESNMVANVTPKNEWLKNSTLIIYYTPNNTFTLDILRRARKNDAFVAGHTMFFPSTKPGLASLKASLVHELTGTNRTNLMSRGIFGVEFRSDANDKNFRYTIVALYPLLQKDSRMLYSETFAVASSEKEDAYVTSGFLGLQFALDKAFIEFRSSEVKDQSPYQLYKNVTFLQLPYARNAVQRNPERLIYHLTLIGFVFLALTIPYYIATEKHSGMKEMMKMIGMSELTIWFGWITYSLMVYPLVSMIIVLILKTGLTIDPFYRYVDPIFLWIIFILYCIANMTFLFAISTLITKHWVAVVVSMIVCFLTAVPFGLTRFTNEYEFHELAVSPAGRHILLCLIPNLVMYNALKALQYFEMKEQRTGWASIVTDIKDPRIYSLRTILAYFVANIVLNSIIVMYVSSIRPGRYGDRKNPFFFITACFDLFRKKKDNKSLYEDITMSSQFVEPVDEDDISIQIVDLQKTFGYFNTQVALKNVNLSILKGEITVILGHNGAGKSTLLNVICGMSSKSNGEMFQNIKGDLVNTNKLVGKVGFCPQHIIYFNYLTVEEHILFFGMARGMSQIKATKEAHYVMSIFDMQEKSNNLVYELSGGMKRKLGLLIALIGRSDILILDEPTSGMDVNSRRITWDLLKKIKRNRVIIMTTQDMEEADIIGNRIAIMHDGQIFCCGSPNFLKHLFGTGYNLILSKGRNFNVETTNKLVTGVIPSASVSSNTNSTIEFNLPLLASGSFAYLFKKLEEKLASLSITRIQMFCTTMDQVFLNVTFLAGKSTEKFSNYVPLPSKDVPIELRSGLSLVLFQISALFMKKFKLSYRRHNRFLSCIFLAMILGYTNVAIINWTYSIFGSTEYPRLHLTIKMYKYPEGFIFSSNATSEFNNTYTRYFEECGGSIESGGNLGNITEIINKFGNYNLYELRDNLMGAVVLNDTEKRILFNELIPHSAPISLNVYTTSLLRYVMKNTTYNDSLIEADYLPISLREHTTYCTASDTTSYYMFPLFWWVFIFHSAILALFVFFISFIISERVNGIKHIQTMSNLSEFTYWFGNFVYDYVLYVAVMAIIVGVMKITDKQSIIPLEDLKYLVQALLLYGISGLLYCYVYASVFESISIFMLISVVLNISCLTTFVAMQLKGSSLMSGLRIVTAIFPPFSFLNFLSRYLYVIISSNHCVYCLDFERNKCEETTIKTPVTSPITVSDHKLDSAYTFLLFLIFDILLYGILLIPLNSILASWFSNFLVGLIFGKNVIVDPNDEKEEDKFVIAEKEYLKNIFNSKRRSNHALMVYNLKKNLIVGGFHKFTAVADVNFYVDKSSCFGIVGINGAGKSTTFKILTAFVLPTAGDAKVHNVSLRRDIRKYTSMIGSCPQSNTTFEELTGREMLHLTATLRGLKKAGKHVENWVSILNMENFQDNLIETYSSGGKRKLCVALSLIGDPKVVFLDEPTSGVDPVGRQNIYQIIKSKKLAGQAVVIASHNMKECEILCDRVTVLHNGVLKRIGSITALKKQYANGFTLVVKLRMVMDYSDKMNSIVDAIFNKFGKYRCILRDQRVGSLQFRILSEEVLWSQMFGGMEEIKRYNAIIEEYIITNATIAEEIFIQSLNNPAKTMNL